MDSCSVAAGGLGHFAIASATGLTWPRSERPRTIVGTLATADEIRRICRTLDDAKPLDIIAPRPTTLDVEQASLRLGLAGDPDIIGAAPLDPGRRDCRNPARHQEEELSLKS